MNLETTGSVLGAQLFKRSLPLSTSSLLLMLRDTTFLAPGLVQKRSPLEQLSHLVNVSDWWLSSSLVLDISDIPKTHLSDVCTSIIYV